MNKHIYFKIYTWMNREILDTNNNINNLEFKYDDYYVCIFRRSDDDDIDVGLYTDKEYEDNVWWWIINMIDEDIIYDMNNTIKNIDIESMQKYIKDKTDFAYELIFWEHYN